MVQKVIERSDFSVNFSSNGEKPNKKLNRDDGNFPNGKIQLLGPVDPHSKTLIAQIQKKEYSFLCEIIVGLALTLISVYLSRKKNDSIRLFSWFIGIEVVSGVVQISALFFKNF